MDSLQHFIMATPNTPECPEVLKDLNLTPDQLRMALGASAEGTIPQGPTWWADTSKSPLWEARYRLVKQAIERPETLKRLTAICEQQPESIRTKPEDYIAAAKLLIEGRGSPEWRNIITCREDTFPNALCDLAAFGLVPVPDTDIAYLIPRKSKNVYGISGTPGVAGFERNLLRSGIVSTIQTFAVYEQDNFQFIEGGDADPMIQRPRKYDPSQPNEITAALCIIRLKDGRKMIEMQMYSTDAERSVLDENNRLTREQAAKKRVKLVACRAFMRTYVNDLSLVAAQALSRVVGDEQQQVEQRAAAPAAAQAAPKPATAIIDAAEEGATEAVTPTPVPTPTPTPTPTPAVVEPASAKEASQAPKTPTPAPVTPAGMINSALADLQARREALKAEAEGSIKTTTPSKAATAATPTATLKQYNSSVTTDQGGTPAPAPDKTRTPTPRRW